MMYLMQQLAQYAADLRYEQIPRQAIDAAKKCALDSVANLLYGRYNKTGQKALDYLAAYPMRGPLPETALAGGGTAALEQTILAHTVMARCADLDDGTRRAMGHPGCLLVPTALAVAEAYGKTGKDILCALVAGYDVYVRIGSAVNPSSYSERGFESTGTCGAIAAAAVAGKLMDADKIQMKNAMGIAASFSGGLIEYQNDGSLCKVLCGAWAALTGLRAVQLAKTGFTGPNAILEGKKGFFQAFSNTPCGDHIAENLGSEFRINEIYFKRHACMRGLHSSVDATLLLREKHGLTPETVESITVWTTPFVQRLSNPEPKTEVAAQSSLQFTMAVSLKHGHLSEEKLLTASMQDADIYRLAAKIQCRLSDELQQYVSEHPTHWSAACVEVHTTGGEAWKETVYLPNGEPEQPLSWEQLAEKYRRMTGVVPESDTAERILDRISSLESIQQMTGFWE